MANMSYCRFENTASDLADCLTYLTDRLDNEYETSARLRLIELCREIIEIADAEEIGPDFVGYDEDCADGFTN